MRFTTVHPLNYLNTGGGAPDLFEAVDNMMISRGHQKTGVDDADIVIFDMAVWCLADGYYSPYDDQIIAKIAERKLSVAMCDNWDRWGIPPYTSHDDRFPNQPMLGHSAPAPMINDWEEMRALENDPRRNYATAIMRFVRAGCHMIYFMRKMQASVQYPAWVYPWEYPMFHDEPLASKESYLSRPVDVIQYANQSYMRVTPVIDMFRDGRLKVDAKFTGISNRRIEYVDWLSKHRQSKLFMEADASLGSERPMHLMTVAAMLRVKSDHRLPFPRQDMVHMVEVGDYEGNLSRDDIDKIVSVVNDGDLLYSIYVQGAEHMREHYSLDARSNYVAGLIENLVNK